MPRILLGLLVLALGCAVGSFLNVVRYRLPRKITMVSGRSKCPNCGRTIAWYDNIPVASLPALRGKCRSCGWRIPRIYLVVELATGLAFLLVWLTFPVKEVPAYMVLASLLVVTAGIDYDLRIIPDRLTLPGIVLGVVFSLTLLRRTSLGGALVHSGLGILVGGGSLLVIARGYKYFRKIEGMGDGDIKLMAMVGAFLGWQLSLVTIFLASLVGAIVGIFVGSRSGQGLKASVPYGVFLSPAAVVSMLWGPALVHVYISLVR